MFRNYSPLRLVALPQGTSFAHPSQLMPDRVQMDDPAIDAMTDLLHVAAVIVLAGDTVDEAHQRMLQRRVRLLLVVDRDRKVVGVITADDVAGERPVRFAAQQGMYRDEVLVRNIMAPCSELHALNLDDVKAAKVGHVLATLRLAGRQHALVVDRNATGNIRLRGIFSVTQIFRQLDMHFEPNILASTFAELEVELSH